MYLSSYAFPIMYLVNHIVTSNSSQQISQSTTKKPSVKNAIAEPSGLSGKKIVLTNTACCIHALFIIGVINISPLFLFSLGIKRNRCNAVNNVKSCSTVQLFQKSNSRQEKLNDDDIQSYNSEVCGIDTQEEASLTPTKKRKLKNKSIRGQRTSSSETTRLPLTPSTPPTSYANIPSIRTALAGPSGQSSKKTTRIFLQLLRRVHITLFIMASSNKSSPFFIFIRKGKRKM